MQARLRSDLGYEPYGLSSSVFSYNEEWNRENDCSSFFEEEEGLLNENLSRDSVERKSQKEVGGGSEFA